jgi:methionyl-tRNA formyltransferase
MSSKPRTISIIVDNDSWILPYAQNLVSWVKKRGNKSSLCRDHAEIPEGDIAFYLGCVKITPPEVLQKNKCNLVVHASDLPNGRGFSPWTWLVLDGADEIPICLIEAAEQVDAGPIIYKDKFKLQGSELVDDLRNMIGEKTLELCQRFLNEKSPPSGTPQKGEGSVYPRRKPKDSRLDPDKTIAEQFDLLRVVDNKNYPAFFEYRGKRYKLFIESDDRDL